MKSYFALLVLILLNSCNFSEEKKETQPKDTPITIVNPPKLTLQQANNLAQLPMHCIQVEYPNKLNQVLGNAAFLKEPKVLHPAFYGCFDWHSAVHGHWSLVSLLKQFPKLDKAEAIKKMLLENMSKENIALEIAYFDDKENASFERTYGWAWLLKLAEALHTWETPLARTLENNLEPLTQLIVEKYIAFLPKLNYPIRVGEHPNTAFGLSFAWDYAKAVNHEQLLASISKRAKAFYLKDENCPMLWEPSGYDFLSPCLEEAALMKRILAIADYKAWLNTFLPQLKNKNYSLETGKVSDRTDGKLVHLDGVNFSRAWCLNAIAKDLPEYKHLENIANQHINYSLPNLVGDSYEGGHWLGSFAIYALNTLAK